MKYWNFAKNILMELSKFKFSDETQVFVLNDGSQHEVVGGWDYIVSVGGLKEYQKMMNIVIERNIKCPDRNAEALERDREIRDIINKHNGICTL